jgi:hypothetical protein
MINLYVVAALTAERRRQCPCGAVAESAHGLCRKCQARIAWRRKTMRVGRRGGRRVAARQARTFARLLTETMTRTSASKGGESQ